MALRGFRSNLKPLEILSEEQVDDIYRGALGVLSGTGVRIEHKEALALLQKNGCTVDYDDMRARFPEGLVESCLRNCPSTFRQKARHPEDDLLLGASTVYFTPFPGTDTVDLETWERRVATMQEYVEGVKVLHALDSVSAFANYSPYFGFEGVPPVMAILEGLGLRMAYSSKAIHQEGTPKEGDTFVIEMAKAVGCEIAGSVTGSAPLAFSRDVVETLFKYVEAGFPVAATSGGHVMGATGPVTLAGSLVLDLAADAAILALSQLIRPGARVRLGVFTFPLNMRTGAPAFGSVGTSLYQVARFQVARKYRVPAGVGMPGASSSKRADFQCGYEKAIMALTAAMSGANTVAFHGGVHGELTHHPIQAILDDDIAGMVGRFIEGIEVNEETLAFDLIEQVGPIPGHYLGKQHTRKWWKNENYFPQSADWSTYPEWVKGGKKGCLANARERMEEILATDTSTPLTPEQTTAVADILKEARQYYRKKGLISDDEWRVYMKTLDSPVYPYAS